MKKIKKCYIYNINGILNFLLEKKIVNGSRSTKLKKNLQIILNVILYGKNSLIIINKIS